eukprot:COSAG06_NODE_398_length_16243_cov_3.649839_17_plen_125_part_00
MYSERTRLRYPNYYREPIIQGLEALYNIPLLARRGGSQSMQFINALQLSGLSGDPQAFLAKFKIVVLTEASGLTAQQAEVLTDYAKNGGNLILSGDALRFNETGQPFPGGGSLLSDATLVRMLH